MVFRVMRLIPLLLVALLIAPAAWAEEATLRGYTITDVTEGDAELDEGVGQQDELFLQDRGSTGGGTDAEFDDGDDDPAQVDINPAQASFNPGAEAEINFVAADVGAFDAIAVELRDKSNDAVIVPAQITDCSLAPCNNASVNIPGNFAGTAIVGIKWLIDNDIIAVGTAELAVIGQVQFQAVQAVCSETAALVAGYPNAADQATALACCEAYEGISLLAGNLQELVDCCVQGKIPASLNQQDLSDALPAEFTPEFWADYGEAFDENEAAANGEVRKILLAQCPESCNPAEAYLTPYIDDAGMLSDEAMNCCRSYNYQAVNHLELGKLIDCCMTGAIPGQVAGDLIPAKPVDEILAECPVEETPPACSPLFEETCITCLHEVQAAAIAAVDLNAGCEDLNEKVTAKLDKENNQLIVQRCTTIDFDGDGVVDSEDCNAIGIPLCESCELPVTVEPQAGECLRDKIGKPGFLVSHLPCLDPKQAATLDDPEGFLSVKLLDDGSYQLRLFPVPGWDCPSGWTQGDEADECLKKLPPCDCPLPEKEPEPEPEPEELPLATPICFCLTGSAQVYCPDSVVEMEQEVCPESPWWAEHTKHPEEYAAIQDFVKECAEAGEECDYSQADALQAAGATMVEDWQGQPGDPPQTLGLFVPLPVPQPDEPGLVATVFTVNRPGAPGDTVQAFALTPGEVAIYPTGPALVVSGDAAVAAVGDGEALTADTLVVAASTPQMGGGHEGLCGGSLAPHPASRPPLGSWPFIFLFISTILLAARLTAASNKDGQ